MQRRALIATITLVGIGLTASGCGSSGRVTTTAKVSAPASEREPAPVVADAAAVAALDESATFSIRDNRLVHVDPTTNGVIRSWALPKGAVSIATVAPDGRWVALTDRTERGYNTTQPRAFTELVVFAPESGTVTRRLTLSGDVLPEAFSFNGHLIFALDFRGDFYRVQTINLATGERVDTGNRDKSLERENMHGITVRGVLSADRKLLATLYRNPGDDTKPAYVHILDLVHSWAYCADLPAPFGTGPAGSDQIELTPAGTVVVTTTQASRIAEIHINEVLEPSTVPVTVEYRDANA
jgi:hypothetical protein